jgi:hypothetical protein
LRALAAIKTATCLADVLKIRAFSAGLSLASAFRNFAPPSSFTVTTAIAYTVHRL